MKAYFTHKTVISQGDGEVLYVHKQRGETLASLLNRVRSQEGIDPSIPLTYAGRLDPMADGLVIVLAGNECKNKALYTMLPKTYLFTVLFGVSTDTFDVLGIPTYTDTDRVIDMEALDHALKVVRQHTSWTYPPYSSKPVDGIPLFVHARNNTLPETMPVKEGNIISLVCTSAIQVDSESLIGEIHNDIDLVEGDFRQEESKKAWRSVRGKVYLAHCVATVSSGVYIRSIAASLGEVLGIPSLAYSITRTHIGTHTLTNK